MSIIHSMTGSASKLVNSELANINIDITSVNSRFLEIYLKLPDSLRHLDSKLRAVCQEKMTRGKIDCYISFAINFANTLNVNNDALSALTDALDKIKTKMPQAQIS